MKKQQEMVREFMEKAGQETPVIPQVPNPLVQVLRLRLHKEEAVEELDQAFMRNDLVLIADSIADSLVVILGTAVACGINIEPIFDEVMRSNMSKFIDGHLDPGGKWIKGPSYSPAEIKPLLFDQLHPS